MREETTLRMHQFASRLHDAGTLLRKMGVLADKIAGTSSREWLMRRRLRSEVNSLNFASASELCAAVDAFAEIDFEDVLQDERGREALADIQDYVARRMASFRDGEDEGKD